VIVVAAVVVMVAVASSLDEPQHLLRATEESPDLSDVHVRLAFFPTTSDKQSFRPEPLVFRAIGKRVRIKVAGHVDGFASHLDPRCLKGPYRREAPDSRLIPREGEA
jgi:hypothetical protein